MISERSKTITIERQTSVHATSPPIKLQIADNLTPRQEERLKEILCKNADTFAKNTKAPPITPLISHRIELDIDQPIRQRPHRTSPQEKEYIHAQVAEMLGNGIIQQSTSKHAAPVVLVKKADGTLRFCCDFRAINSHTKIADV